MRSSGGSFEKRKKCIWSKYNFGFSYFHFETRTMFQLFQHRKLSHVSEANECMKS